MGVLDCCGRCSHIHRPVERAAPRWLLVLSLSGYTGSFVAGVVALVLEAVLEQEDQEVPAACVAFALGFLQYSVECLLAYGGIVVLWKWKPYHVLQHHLTAVVLCITLNIQLFVDRQLWIHLLRSSFPLRLIFSSCALTGINEAIWVASNFVASPKGKRLAWLRVSCGILCLVQNLIICMVCLPLYSVNSLWPLFKDHGSVLPLAQILVNGVLQPLFFHLGLQGMVFLRLQFKLTKRLYLGDATIRPAHEDTAAVETVGKAWDSVETVDEVRQISTE